MDDCVNVAYDNVCILGGLFMVVDSMDVVFEGVDVVYFKSWGFYDLMLECVVVNKV